MFRLGTRPTIVSGRRTTNLKTAGMAWRGSVFSQTEYAHSVESMLSQRPRRWDNIDLTLCQQDRSACAGAQFTGSCFGSLGIAGERMSLAQRGHALFTGQFSVHGRDIDSINESGKLLTSPRCGPTLHVLTSSSVRTPADSHSDPMSSLDPIDLDIRIGKLRLNLRWMKSIMHTNFNANVFAKY